VTSSTVSCPNFFPLLSPFVFFSLCTSFGSRLRGSCIFVSISSIAHASPPRDPLCRAVTSRADDPDPGSDSDSVSLFPKGARLTGSRGGDTCAIDEMETKTHESRRREPTEAYKGKKTKGERRRKDLDMKRCRQSGTTNLTLRVSDTECTESNFALDERSGARRT
jgi:hypothetical protein